MSDVDNYGFKVSKEGASVESTDPRDIIMSSTFRMLKYHDTLTDSITFSPGDTHQFVDFAHTLGYVPAFIVYAEDFNDGKEHFIPGIPYGTSYEAHYYAFADSSKIRAGLTWDVGSYAQINTEPDDWWLSFGGIRGAIEVGNQGGTGTDGAFRFIDINIAQGTTITSASIQFFVGVKGAGVGDLKIKTYGIDEDNTADFGSDPMGRSQTSALTTQTVSLPPTGEYFGINVTSQVQEILDRGGWSSGNAMGFLIFNDSSPFDVFAFDSPVGTNSYLQITSGADITLTFRVIIFKDKLQ